jgi:hypothetical protein
VAERHGLGQTVAALAGFLSDVDRRKGELVASLDQDAEDDTLAAFFRQEVRWAARDLGISSLELGQAGRFDDLGGGR